MDYQNVIDRIHGQLQELWGQGRVADYIPALAKVDPRQFGIAVATLDGQEFRTGDAQVCFSIQSISKVFTLAMVTGRIGDDIWKAVGREPSGNPFNSLVQLEYEHGLPRNPFINAGALVVTDRLISLYPHPKDAMLEFVRALCANDDIYYDKEIARSERLNADRNLALAYFMKSFGNIENDVETLLDVYCHQCAISMSCADLARAFLFLSNRGVNPFDGRQVLTVSQAKRLGALMLKYTHYKYFFGKVTMYTSYNLRARNTLLNFLHKYFGDPDSLVTAIDPIDYDSGNKYYLELFKDLDYHDAYKVLQKEIKLNGEFIPPLINSYMNLSPSMKVFGTAVNPGFGKVEETGILVKMEDIYPEKKERHLAPMQEALRTMAARFRPKWWRKIL